MVAKAAIKQSLFPLLRFLRTPLFYIQMLYCKMATHTEEDLESYLSNARLTR
jgi:hypothetical protein